MSLLVAPCSHQAASYAVKRWHYSGSLPTPPIVKFGVWEDDVFIGVVLFARGATQNLGKPYGLDIVQICDLSRVALRAHQAPVSQIVAAAVKQLKQLNPRLRLIVSFADPEEDHHGGIYQAMNWLYTGTSNPSEKLIDKRGRVWHPRQLSPTGWKKQYGEYRAVTKTTDCERIKVAGKHRYLLPLDRAMRRQLADLAQPYPCRQSVESDTSRIQREEVGAAPTDGSNSTPLRKRP